MLLNSILKSKIREISLKNIPYESCGLIIKKNEDFEVYSCKNISSYKEKHFELDSLDYVRASREGKIVAVWHSQGGAEPSELDNFNSNIHKIYSIIYSWEKDDFLECADSYLFKYTTKEFEIGKHDCFSLVQDYYRDELDIVIGNYERKEGWLETNPKIILENFEKEGFKKIEGEMKKNDVILFDLLNKGMVHHMGIYVGNNNYLHHTRNKKSTVEFMTDSLKNKIGFIVRHNKYL